MRKNALVIGLKGLTNNSLDSKQYKKKLIMTTTFNTLITGDLFRFSDEETVYIVCYNKHCVIGNNVIEEVENPNHKQNITPFMMDREVIKIPDNEINYV